MRRNGSKHFIFCRRSLLLVITFIYLELSSHVTAKFYPSIRWSPRNPRFKDRPVFRLNVLPMSKLYIECPHPSMVLTAVDDAQPISELYENFWIVDNTSFSTCNVNTSIKENRILKKCDSPSQLNYHQLIFQKFSAVLADLVFLPEKTYYFISTSSGFQNSLDSTSGGHCKTANMRMEIYICKDSKDPYCSEVKPTTSVAVDVTKEHTVPSRSTEKASTTVSLSVPKNINATQDPFIPVSQDPAPYRGEEEQSNQLSLRESFLIGSLAILFITLVLVILYYERVKGKGKESRPNYGRTDSCAPALMDGHRV